MADGWKHLKVKPSRYLDFVIYTVYNCISLLGEPQKIMKENVLAAVVDICPESYIHICAFYSLVTIP